MIVPDPAALLLDHPAIPLPDWCHDAVERGRRYESDPARLSARDRRRVAVQLTAAAALLSEHDLWPGIRAVREARVRRTAQGLQVELGVLPRSLSTLSRRLGGGQLAAERLRDRFFAELRRRFAVALPTVVGEGYFLEPWLHKLLDGMDGDLDLVTARNLWALRWGLPPSPAVGEVGFWATPTAAVGARIGAALWSHHRRRGEAAWLRRIGDDDATAPLPPVGTTGVVILVGDVTEEELWGMLRWAERPGCAAVAVGQFPPGWAPPPAPLDTQRLERHLSFVGAPLASCRELVEQRRGRFHPLSRNDRRALTEAALRLVAGCDAGAAAVATEPLVEWLRLLPEGLPEGFFRLHVGIPEASLEHRATALGIVRRDGRWRHPEPAAMAPDPRHRLVADLFAADDPRRLRHQALAGQGGGVLLQWCRERLAALAPEDVQRLLANVERGALGWEIEGAFASACLLRCDLAGARRATAAMAMSRAEPWRHWCDAVDRLPGRSGLVARRHEAAAPLAAAAVALDRLRRGSAGSGARQVLARVHEHCGGAVGRWLELERAAFEVPARLRDRGWRRTVVGDHPWLRHRLAQLYALQQAAKHPAVARRLLARAATGELTPGERGLLELDRGFVELAAGATDGADVHSLRALHLLEAAGFEGRTRNVRFNLAVTDLDRLQVESAASRLAALDADDPFVMAEQARWQLAVGDEVAFDVAVGRLTTRLGSDHDPRLAAALNELVGVRALLAGDTAVAEDRLGAAGEEARPWLELGRAGAGRGSSGELQDDSWGVAVAAGWLRSGWPEPNLSTPVWRQLRMALAVALAVRLGGDRPAPDAQLREAAATSLHAAGLVGWARLLRRHDDSGQPPLDAVVALLEHGDPGAVDERELERLMQWLGIGGVEVRGPGGEAALWRFGDGVAGAATRASGVDVTPLGGEPGVLEWRLFCALVGLLLGRRPMPTVASDGDTLGMAGTSPAMATLRREIRRHAPTRISVLLIGETGTGKELAARALHHASGRHGSFVAVNMAAIPDNLLESELFGAVRGAFTGADRSRRGLAVAADGGTLFLDEIGDLSLPLQVKLLRFLESGEVRAVGSDVITRVDVRIVAATHRDLAQRVSAGTFREDLFFRIAAAVVPVPALRERCSDIPVLRAAFEQEAVLRHELRPCHWSHEAERALEGHAWPGNVRELRHAVEVAMVHAAGGTVTAGDLPFRSATAIAARPASGRWDEALRNFKRELLTAALRDHGGNRSATARALGLSRQALLYHLRALGVS